jgi:hypothetical protein
MASDLRLDMVERLIQEKQFANARRILVSILKNDSKDPQAWYLYSRVARNPQEAAKVLQHVLELDPLNYQAKADLNHLQQRSLAQLAQAAAESEERNTVGYQYVVYGAAGLVAFVVVAIIAFMLVNSS